MAKKKQPKPQTNGHKNPQVPTEDVLPSPMGPWGPGGIRAPRKPNLYQLRGESLNITYSPASFNGQSYFMYHDRHRMLEFYGDAIRSGVQDFGTFVSVVLDPEMGPRSTMFTVLLPNVTLAGTTQTQIETFGLTTIQEIGIDQNEMYGVTELSGTAAIVEF